MPKPERHAWEKSYPPGLAWGFQAQPRPVYALFEASVTAHPARTCLNFLGREYSYVEVQGHINALAAALQNLGVKKGDRVGLCLPNSPYAVIGYFAALRIGATVVNFNPLYTQAELAHQTTDSGTTVMITVDITKILVKVKNLVGPTPLRHIVVCSLARALPPLTRVLFNIFRAHQVTHFIRGRNIHRYEDIALPGCHPKPVTVNPKKDIALLQYTGGTTGTPKGAMLTHANIVANTRQVQMWMGPPRAGGECFIAILPLFHVFAMTACMNLALATASTLILLPAFNLKQLINTLHGTGVTIFPGVPTLFNALLDYKGIDEIDLSAIRWCISGGAPLPLTVKQRFEKLTGCTLVEGYGLTEASPVVACNPPHHSKSGSVGLPLPGTLVEVRALENPKSKLRPGQTGELCFKGPQVMAGYWRKPKQTKQVLQSGWLRTGDVGHIDKDGYIFLTDRAKDIIITNGYNVYPRVIEEAAYKHPAVAEVTAIAIPSLHKGEVAKVFVRLKDGATATEAELLAFLRENLNPIERPAEVEIRAALPKTLTGKLSKKELAAEEKQKRE